MNLLESAISLIAPHDCVACRTTGRVLCKSCAVSCLYPVPSRCYRCKRASPQNRTCRSCLAETGLSRVWAATWYESSAKELVRMLKFERAKAAAEDIARIMDENLPLLPEETVVVHLPTAANRIRARGYDQARLIARKLAKSRGLKHQDLLGRKGSIRQVGSSRKKRFKQLEGAFSIKDKSKVRGRNVLLIDDVLTTGASIESAARELQASGAKKIEAAVFAQS